MMMSCWQPTTSVPYPEDLARARQDIAEYPHLRVLATVPTPDHAPAVRAILDDARQTRAREELERHGNYEIWTHACSRILWATAWLREI